jgi:hypothetical protein
VKQKAIQSTMVPLKQQAHFVQVTGFHPEHDRIITQCIQTGWLVLILY